MSKEPLIQDQLTEEVQRQGRLLLHQFKRQEDLIEIVKEECEKDNIELFRNIHHNNQLLKNLVKTIEREDILHHRVSQLEAKIQKITEKLDLILNILQKKL